jgi:hypothetical protein
MYSSNELTQYGNARAPAIPPSSGGAAVLSNLASGAFGMLSGGGLPAIQGALDLAKDGSTTQTADSGRNAVYSGSKVFNTPAGGDGLTANSFWQSTIRSAANGGSMVWILAGAVVLGVVYFISRRK